MCIPWHGQGCGFQSNFPEQCISDREVMGLPGRKKALDRIGGSGAVAAQLTSFELHVFLPD